MIVTPDPNLTGSGANWLKLLKREGVRLIDLLRCDISLRCDLSNVFLEIGDRLVLRPQITALLSL